MRGRAELVAFCGIYCGDCLGYTGVIAGAARTFAAVLDRYQFERTAAWIFPEQLGDYDRFREILAFMGGLRCSGICRNRQEDGGPSTCEVKNCAWIVVSMPATSATNSRHAPSCGHCTANCTCNRA